MADTTFLERAVACAKLHAAATIYEAIGKRGEVGPDIRPVQAGFKLVGPAWTVRCLAGDAKAIWLAIEAADPGSVIVVDNGGSPWVTAIGGTSVRAALRRGIAGFVLNGAVRDTAEIRALGLPVFASGTSLRGTIKSHDGWQTEPVAIGAAVVAQGDLVVGDDDGVVIVPSSLLPTLEERSQRQAERERATDDAIDGGKSIGEAIGLR
jgi:4-hydroxy-4-methyl-2-oxoglutarate aldolase